ncbi:MAG: CPBP family intramembrane glutamic endopeptidase [Phycisphaerae bacterium]
MVKEDKSKFGSGQLLNFAKDSYLERTSRPIYALMFLLPFIIFYELGTIFINTDVLDKSQIRVVAFVWLQQGLEYINLGGKFSWVAPPLFVVIILLWMQLASRKSWSFIVTDVIPMTVECILIAIPLLVLSLVLNSSSAPSNAAVYLQNGSLVVDRSLLADVVTGIGAGIYEELIFRLILISLLMIIFQDVLRLEHSNAIILSIFVSAALFSAHHHLVFLDGRVSQSSPFSFSVFIFRTIAGVYFATVFAVRGFGITAGAHAFYDILATIINAAFFSEQY